MAAFLAAELAAYLQRLRHDDARRRQNLKDSGIKPKGERAKFHPYKIPWLATKMADDLDTAAVPSQETLRRLLRFDVEQDAESATLTPVARFLVRHEQLTPEDVAEVAAADPGDFMVLPVPGGPRANLDFARSMVGEYRAYRVDGPNLFETRLTLALEKKPSTDKGVRLMVAHRERVHAGVETPAIVARSRCLHPAYFGEIEDHLRVHAGRAHRAERVHFGALFANASLAFAVAKAWGNTKGRNADMAVQIRRIVYDGEFPTILAGTRTSNWTLAEAAELPDSATGPDLATHLFEGAEDHLAFVRRVHPKPTRAYGTRRRSREDSGEDSEKGKGHFGFAAEADGDIPDAALDAIERAQEAIGIETRRRAAFFEETAPPTERLCAALDWFDDDQAIRAIADGADVNAIHVETGEPLVFAAAEWNRAPVLRAMLATGRLDLSVRDAAGRPPSRRISDPDLFVELCAAELDQQDAKDDDS
jgi:hypothetical protein